MLKGVVGRGWVQCLGRWLWLGSAFGLWLKWVVGCGSASWGWIDGLGSVNGGFEMVDLLIDGWIGWVDH